MRNTTFIVYMTLTADSGSTKTTWLVEQGGGKRLFHTQGLNPFHQTAEEMRRIVTVELLGQEGFPDAATMSNTQPMSATGTTATAHAIAQAAHRIADTL